ncbi:hypothetical protein V6N11_078661 [Hibiscus sabdariffa]|uniref:Secreted protein n=1 Tax=Hibiscus sabdariffa TaxID=183260 RepID=A0ABR2THL3_9ROSI
MDQMKPCFCWVGLLLGLRGVEPSRVTGAGLARRPGDGEPVWVGWIRRSLRVKLNRQGGGVTLIFDPLLLKPGKESPRETLGTDAAVHRRRCSGDCTGAS